MRLLYVTQTLRIAGRRWRHQKNGRVAHQGSTCEGSTCGDNRAVSAGGQLGEIRIFHSRASHAPGFPGCGGAGARTGPEYPSGQPHLFVLTDFPTIPGGGALNPALQSAPAVSVRRIFFEKYVVTTLDRLVWYRYRIGECTIDAGFPEQGRGKSPVSRESLHRTPRPHAFQEERKANLLPRETMMARTTSFLATSLFPAAHADPR